MGIPLHLSMQDQYLIEWEEEQFRSVLSDTLAQRRWKTLITSQVVCLILDNFCLIFHGLTGDENGQSVSITFQNAQIGAHILGSFFQPGANTWRG